jgi:hypothetical protein
MLIERAFVRHRMRINGKILAPSTGLWAECCIVDISQSGAVLTLAAPALPPNRFYLWQAKTNVLFECELQWQRDGMLRVGFVNARPRRRRCADVHNVTLIPLPRSVAA